MLKMDIYFVNIDVFQGKEENFDISMDTMSETEKVTYGHAFYKEGIESRDLNRNVQHKTKCVLS